MLGRRGEGRVNMPGASFSPSHSGTTLIRGALCFFFCYTADRWSCQVREVVQRPSSSLEPLPVRLYLPPA